MAGEPMKVVTGFQNRVSTSMSYYEELVLAVHMKRRQASLETMLAEQFVLTSAVLWEVFINDLLLSYVVARPDVYLERLKKRVAESIKGKFGPEVVRFHNFDPPKSVSRAKAAALIDPKNFNVTVKNADELAKRANDLLSAEFAKKFTLEVEDAQLVDCVLAWRNFLAHRSTASRERLRETIAPLSGCNRDLAAPLRDVGSYLKYRNKKGLTRAAFMGVRLSEVAGVLK